MCEIERRAGSPCPAPGASDDSCTCNKWMPAVALESEFHHPAVRSSGCVDDHERLQSTAASAVGLTTSQ
eukprot:9808986-Lingulodinium_polyedra.AAC.1